MCHGTRRNAPTAGPGSLFRDGCSGGGRRYVRDDNLRIGCTPDVFVKCPHRGRGIVQVKTVEPRVFREKWKGGSAQGEIEAPLWITIQAIVEARLTGADFACVAPMVVSHGVDMPLLEIPLHDGIWAKLVAKVDGFWKSVAEKKPPQAD